MRRLLLTTASVVALGLGGIGLVGVQAASTDQPIAHGSNQTTNPSTNENAANPSTNENATNPSANENAANPATNEQQNPTAMTPKHRTGKTSLRTRTGMPRNEIMQAQRQLRADRLYRGRIDGKFGPRMKIALRQFQERNHLKATARLDRQTMGQLMGGGNIGQGSSMAPTRRHTHRMGQGTSLAPKKNRSTTNMGQGSSTPPTTTQQPQGNSNLGTSQPNMPSENQNQTQTNKTQKY